MSTTRKGAAGYQRPGPDPGARHKRHRRTRRRLPAPRRVALPVAAAVLIAAVGLGVRAILEPSPSCQKTLIPAYFYPGPGWTAAIGSNPPPSLMILDITKTGAGSSPDRTYQATVKRAQAAGITIMGYAATHYAKRSPAAVEADIRHYKTWYDVTDIFLDQAASGAADVAYYQRLSGYAHHLNPGSTVMLNPGTFPDQQYMSTGDIVMVYENTYRNFVDLHVPRWAASYPADRFAYAIYAASSTQLPAAIRLAQHRNAGYVYITSGTGKNPYRALPSYWHSENATITAGC